MVSITVENISKNFRIYKNPRDRLWEFLSKKPRHNLFNALRNISFQLNQGDTLGIIGCNGAGKSTLLKLLARTITPSSGQIIINGRVTALLELGSGFNPEFTGRENIFLNASLLGMSTPEIKKKEKEIIAFAELQDFIDQPIKTYSSGMQVRLAFSIATSVDPDILIIDEALSVGDESFQRKCIARMNAFKEQKKILLFCSHSMYQINLLCKRTIWIENGQVKMDGDTDEITKAYEEWHQKKQKPANNHDNADKQETAKVPCRVTNIALLNENKEVINRCEHKQPVIMHMDIEATEKITTHFGFAVIREDELLCCGVIDKLEGMPPTTLHPDKLIQVEVKIPQLLLLDGTYRLQGGMLDESGLHIHHQALSDPFTVRSKGYRIGIFSLPHSWKTTQHE